MGKPAGGQLRTFKVWSEWADRKGVLAEQWLSKRKPSKLIGAIARFADLLTHRPWIAFVLLYLLLCSRAIFWLANPQFYIEDGPEFYARAYNSGWGTVFREYASYYHVVPRLLALVAAMFPVKCGPLVLQLLAMGVTAGCAAFLCSERLSKQVPSNTVRMFMAFIVVAYPYSNELFANVAHSQWYLGVLLVSLLCAEPAKRIGGRISDTLLFALGCLSSPFAPILALISWSKWTAQGKRKVLGVVSTIAALVVGITILTHPRSGIPHNARASLVERMVSNQVFLGATMGFSYVMNVMVYHPFFDQRDFQRCLLAIAIMYFGLRKSPTMIKALATLGIYCFLTSMVAKNSWIALGNPGVGERYFFFLGLAFLYCLYALGTGANHSIMRWLNRGILACCCYGIVMNWVYAPPYHEFDYPRQIARFDQMKRGESITFLIPIDRKEANGKWTVTLVKK